MAKKKSKRPNLPEQTLARARAELYGEPMPEPVKEDKPTKATASSTAATAATTTAPAQKKVKYVPAVSLEDLKADYNYVMADLQSMGLVAIALVIIMIIVAAVVI